MEMNDYFVDYYLLFVDEVEQQNYQQAAFFFHLHVFQTTNRKKIRKEK